MNATKTFGVSGYSTRNGIRKVRFAKDMRRAKTLERTGHKDIVLYELPYPMTREQCVEFLVTGVAAPAAPLFVAPAAPVMTLEEALAQVPVRTPRGHFIKREVREQMARDLIAA
jgi:hypothetical protein